MNDTEVPNCARCPYKSGDRLCTNENGKGPDNCPTKTMQALAGDSLKEYEKDAGLFEFARQASIQERPKAMRTKSAATPISGRPRRGSKKLWNLPPG